MLRAFLRNNLSQGNKKLLRRGLRSYPLLTAKFRTLPDWLIIGAQKSGSTSLYFYLLQHPQNCFAIPDIKEPQFFNKHYKLGVDYYKSHFPLKTLEYIRKIGLSRYQTGEATPEYLFHPYSPSRAHQIVPNAKIIIILRDPIERAYSHWNMMRTRGERVEKLSFEDAINLEEERIRPEYERMLTDPLNFNWSGPLEWFSYLERGKYVDQIENWLKFFPREQMLILDSNKLLTEPTETYSKTLKFLGLDSYDKVNFNAVQVGAYQSKVPASMREKLLDKFKPYNERLKQYVDWSIEWNK